MKEESVGSISCWARMNILEVVMGSNHFLTQPQTTGKNEGAPITLNASRQYFCRTREAQLRAHKYPVQNFRVVSGGQCARLLHVASEVPKLLQPNLGDINDIVGLIDWCFWIPSAGHGRTERHDKAGKVLVEGKKPKAG